MIFEKEALAVIFALKKFPQYLLSSETSTLITDYQALCTASKKEDLYGRLARWMNVVVEHRFDIECRSGNENLPVEFLSRVQKED